MVQGSVALAAGLPLLVDAAGIPETVAGVGVVPGVAAAGTRGMAPPMVQGWLRRLGLATNEVILSGATECRRRRGGGAQGC